MAASAREEQELPVIRALHDLILWLVPKVGKFPRDLRFTLGERIERQSYDIIVFVLRATQVRPVLTPKASNKSAQGDALGNGRIHSAKP